MSKELSHGVASPLSTATAIPDNERWLHQPQAAHDLAAALAWAQANPSDDSNVDDILAKLNVEVGEYLDPPQKT